MYSFALVLLIVRYYIYKVMGRFGYDAIVSVFMFFITLIGGNCPLLVPFVRSFLSITPSDVDIQFYAQPIASPTAGMMLNLA